MASVEFRSGGLGGAYRRRVGDFAHGAAQVGGPDTAGAMGAGPGLGGRLGRVINYVAAVVSVGLVVGLGVWGVRLVSRDVSGVPVIRAMTGESRVAPDDPGGLMAAHTGLSVNEVPAGRVGTAPGDQVAIAPGEVGLGDEDRAMGTYGAEPLVPGALSDSIPEADLADPAVALQDSEVARQRAEAETAAAEAAEAAARAEAEAQAALSIDAPASDAAVNEAVTDMSGAPVDAAAITEALAAANATIQDAVATEAPRPPGALAHSPRPAARPARTASKPQVTPVASPAPTSPAATSSAPPRPEAAPVQAAARPETPAPQAATAGAAVVQIGAFDSDAIARSEWDRIAGRAGGLFAGKGQIVQRHESAGRVFYRLRVAGFGSTNEAQSFCSQLKSLGTDCLAMKVN